MELVWPLARAAVESTGGLGRRLGGLGRSSDAGRRSGEAKWKAKATAKAAWPLKAKLGPLLI